LYLFFRVFFWGGGVIAFFAFLLIYLSSDVGGVFTFSNESDVADVQVFDVNNGTYTNLSGDLIFDLSTHVNRDCVCYYIDGSPILYIPNSEQDDEWRLDGVLFKDLGEGHFTAFGGGTGRLIRRIVGDGEIMFLYSASRGLLAMEPLSGTQASCASFSECLRVLEDGQGAYIADQSGFLSDR
jgi:hypothetical protein